MVEICKGYEGESIVSPLPTQSEWCKANMPLVHKGLYKKETTNRKKFKTLKRHYAKKKV
jgi:hypothetical protein